MRLTLATVPPDVGAYQYEPVSDDSQAVSRGRVDERNFLRRSALDWAPLVEAAFGEIRRSSASANWDGRGARPISQRTLALAELVVAMLYVILPKSTPAPDVFPEADGEIGLSWSGEQDRVFSISLGDHGNANYAGQFGTNGGVHGWQPLAMDSRSAFEGSLREIAEHIDKSFAPPLGNVRAEEELSTFVTDKKQVVRSTHVRYDRLMPRRNRETGRLESSVCRSSDLEESALWAISSNHFDPHSRVPAIGRGVGPASAVYAQGLSFDADGKPYPEHANIIGWAEEVGRPDSEMKNSWMNQAQRMASQFRYQPRLSSS